MCAYNRTIKKFNYILQSWLTNFSHQNRILVKCGIDTANNTFYGTCSFFIQIFVIFVEVHFSGNVFVILLWVENIEIYESFV